LRRATEVAARRGHAAGVDDVLWTILNYGRDVPAVALLRRMTPDWQRPGWLRESVPAQLASTPEQHTPPRAVAQDSVLPRIAAIEDGLRALHAEIGSERKAVAELIRDIQRDVVAQRGDQASFRVDLGQRLEALERSLQVRGDATRIPAQMADRMLALEKAVHSGLGEGARNWAALGQRLQALEAAVQGRAENGDAAPWLSERLGGLEATLDQRSAGLQRGIDGFADKLAQIERLAQAGAGEGGRHWAALSERIGTIETLLKSREGGAAEPGGVADRLAAVEHALRSGFGETARAAAEIRERVLGLERRTELATSGHADDGALLVEERLAAVERTFVSRLDALTQTIAKSERRDADIAELVRTLEKRAVATPIAPPVPQIMDAGRFVEPVTRQLADFAAKLAERDRLIGELVQQTSERVAALEELALSSGGTALASSSEARDGELAALREMVGKLTASQSDLASAIGNWRHEVLTDLGSINSRLDLLAATVPVALPKLDTGPAMSVTRVVPEMAATTTDERDQPLARTEPVASEPLVEPAGHRRGFWYWLFGASNIGSANRDAGMRFERLQNQLREARERRRREA
jgi:hypothetical protein